MVDFDLMVVELCQVGQIGIVGVKVVDGNVEIQ